MFRTTLMALLGASICVAEVSTQPANLESLVDEALAANPSLSALQKRIATFEKRLPYAGAPPDPMMRFSLVNVPGVSLDFGRTPMSGKQISLMQTLPFPGTLREKTTAAKEVVSAAESRLLDHRLQITRLVKVAYYDLAFYDQAIDITRENETVVRSIAERALARYEAGSGRQHDVLQAGVSLSLLSNRVTGFETSRRLAVVRLNGLLGRAPDGNLEIQVNVHVQDVTLSIDDLLAVAEHNSKTLRELTHQIREWEARERVAQKTGLPTLTLSVAYRQRNAVPGDPVVGDDFLSAGIGLTLPVFRGRKQSARAAEARATVQWLQARFEEERQRLGTELQRIVVELQLHQSEQELFIEQVLPQTEQALRSARSAYEADLVDFSTLQNAQSTWLDAELMRFHHAVAHAKLLAELEATVGISLQDQFVQRPVDGGRP